MPDRHDLIALGAKSDNLFGVESNPLAGALVLRVSLLPEPTLVLMQNGVEISNVVPCPDFTAGGELAIRWKQNSASEITKVEALLDGTSILKHEGSVSVPGGSVVFGGRMDSEQTMPKGFGLLVIDSLRYTRE